MSLFPARADNETNRTLACLVALLTVAAVGASSPNRLDAQQQSPSAAPTAAAKKATRKQLSLRNTTKDTVTIELRLGDAPDCAANPPATTQRLPPGREWLIASARPICWRRSDAKAPLGLSSWHRHILKAGDQLELTI
jgi:hypothetical protein